MEKKTYTFLMVSNRKGVVQKYVVAAAWLKAAFIVGILGFVIVTAVIVDYFGLLVQSVENKRLKTENLHLKSQFKVVEAKVNSLEAGLERVRGFATKLQLITDTENQDRTLKLAVGPLAGASHNAEEMNEPMSQRTPSSHLESEEGAILEKPPLDIERGELAVEEQRDYATLSIRIDRAIKETTLRETSMLELWDALSSRQSLLRSTPSIRPARGWFTSQFGYRPSPYTGSLSFHQGLDIAAAPGSPVYAPADGVISYAGYDSTYGRLVSIDHGYGVVTRFGHNSQLFVVQGQKIKRGEVLASVGSTGRSTGPHLHYEVRINGVPVDPANYILDE